MNISKRIKEIANRIKHRQIADIGTDHGYLPIFAITNNLADSAIAADVNKHPLECARANAEVYGVSDVIEFRLGYGLDVLEVGEAETIVIAGMGGSLMAEILHKGRDIAASAKQLLLSPHLDVPHLRRELHALGFVITDETMLRDDGKYYNILDVRTQNTQEYDSGGDYSEDEYLLGRNLLNTRPLVFVEYCRHMAQRYANVVAEIESANELGETGAEKLAQAKRLYEIYSAVE